MLFIELTNCAPFLLSTKLFVCKLIKSKEVIIIHNAVFQEQIVFDILLGNCYS
jgi:hypothetical protein